MTGPTDRGGASSPGEHPSPGGAASAEKIVHLETLIAHLQYDVEQLNAALLRQQAELKSLRDALDRIERRLTASLEGPEVRDPLLERPPHY